MEPRKLLEILEVAEHLKDATRHCYTSKGRHESVAEHCWMMTLMAFFMKDEFPDVDMNKVMEMCIIHDLGEAFTGDIPSFNKTAADEKREEEVLAQWVSSLPEPYAKKMKELGDRLVAVHLKDGVREDWDDCGKPLGQGNAPVKAVREYALEKQLPIVVESESLTPDGPTEVQVCFDYLKSLEA